MGLATVIFTVHTDRQGRLVADVWVYLFRLYPNPINGRSSHDDVLENSGKGGKRFTQKNEPQVTEMKRLFLDYMKSLRHLDAEPEPDSAVGDGSEHTEHTDPEIKITALGYPVLPNVIMKKELSKVHCEKLLRIYMSQHYCACISLSG